MSAVRTIARPMLAGMFVLGGVDTLRNPRPKVPVADDVAQPVADALPVDLPSDTEQLVKLNAAVQVGAGLLLSIGRLPRLSALALAATLVPTTAAAHRFWEVDDGAARNDQMIHFSKNVSMLGGLLIAAADTGGRPSIPWLAHRAAKRASERTDKAMAQAHARAEKSRRRAEKALSRSSKRAGRARKAAHRERLSRA